MTYAVQTNVHPPVGGSAGRAARVTDTPDVRGPVARSLRPGQTGISEVAMCDGHWKPYNQRCRIEPWFKRDDDEKEDSVMALIDVRQREIDLIKYSISELQRAIDYYDVADRERLYLWLTSASGHIDYVLGVIERPKNKPRNESSNGPLPHREKRAV